MTGQFLAQTIIGHAIDCCLVHRGVLIDRRFDFDAINVLASAQDHVLSPVADVDKTIVVYTSNIA